MLLVKELNNQIKVYGKIKKGSVLPFLKKNENGEHKIYFVEVDVKNNKLIGIKLEKEIKKDFNKELYYSVLNLEKKMNNNN